MFQRTSPAPLGTAHRFIWAAAVGTTMLAIVAACGTTSPPAGTPPPGAVIVTAVNSLFVPRTVNAPAGQGFALYFDNRDTLPHNARLEDGAGATVAPGEVFAGPSARVAQVPALAAGTYELVCDIHPGMTAELIAAP